MSDQIPKIVAPPKGYMPPLKLDWRMHNLLTALRENDWEGWGYINSFAG